MPTFRLFPSFTFCFSFNVHLFCGNRNGEVCEERGGGGGGGRDGEYDRQMEPRAHQPSGHTHALDRRTS